MMANPYSPGQYSSPDAKLSTPQSAVRSSKRKRSNEPGTATMSLNSGGASPTSGRGAPASRRSETHTFAGDDASNAFQAEPGQSNVATNQFDLSALQAHQSPTHPQHTAGAQSSMDSAAAALNYTMNVPGPPAQDFANQPTTGMDGQQLPDFHTLHNNGGEVGGPGTPGHPGADNGLGSPDRTPGMANKPAVGTDEWHKVRKDNHKEVERRRRETINEGINELAKIVPGCEKNKGSILQRAVQYISKLQDDATSNIDKWTFEKLVTEQAISDLSGKLGRSSRERDAWKRIAKSAGVDVDSVDLGIDDEDDGDGVQDEHSSQQQQAAQAAQAASAQSVASNGGTDKRDDGVDVVNSSAELFFLPFYSLPA